MKGNILMYTSPEIISIPIEAIRDIISTSTCSGGTGGGVLCGLGADYTANNILTCASTFNYCSQGTNYYGIDVHCTTNSTYIGVN